MELSIIIVSYNTADLTKQCIESIFSAVQTDAKLATELELLIVDNHSSDNSVEMLQNLKKRAPIPLTILANTSNAGFAAANNQAMLHAQGEFILLLNSDTIVQPNALTELLTSIKSEAAKNIGILAATLFNADGTVQPQGGDLPTLPALFVFAFMLDDLPLIGKLLPSHQHTGKRYQPPKDKKLQTKGWVAGTAMLIRSNLVPQIGVLDEQIFMYAEDIEYCWRAQKAGWQVAIDPKSQITHLGSKSSSAAKAIEGEFISLRYVLMNQLPKWQVGIGLQLLKVAAYNRALVFSLLNKPEKVAVYKTIAARLKNEL